MKKTTFSSMKDRSKYFLLALLTLFSITASAQFQLNTVPPLNGGNGSQGIVFGLTTNQTILLDTILCSFSSTGLTDVWYTTTDTVGPPTITTANGWTQIGQATVPVAGGTGTIDAIPLNIGLTILPGVNYRFFVNGNIGAAVVYTSGTVGQSAPFTDGIATIETGNLIGYGGAPPSPTFHPRQFNGGIKYSVLGGANDAAVLSVDSPTVFCAGMEDIYATIANFGSNQLDSVIVNWEFNGVVQPSINYTTLLDTLNSPNGNTVSLFLGTESFTSGAPNTIKVWTSMPNGVADTSNFNDTIVAVKAASLDGGVYTIDAGATPSATVYNSFTDFANAVSTFGICGNVTVNVAPLSGPYIEQLNLDGFNGASNRTLTINGNGETISFASSNTNDRAVVNLQNASFVSIDNLTINSIGGTYGYGVFLNNSNDIAITNSTILADTTSTSANYTAVMLSGSMTSAFTGTGFDNFTFTGNTVIGGYYGLNLYGLFATPSQNTIVENNNFRDWYFYGVRLYYTDGMSFSQNDISRPGRTTVTTTYGAYSLGNQSMIMNRNAIHNLFDGIPTSTSTCYPLYNTNDVPVGKEAVIMNNLIYNINHNGTIYAIYDLGSDNNLYYNNIISLDNTSSTAGITRGYYQSSASSGSEFRNNIISITRGGAGAKHGIYLNGTIDASTNNNVFMGSVSGSNNYGFSGGDQATLANFQATGYGANDVDGDPFFTDILLNDYQPLNLSLNAAGFSAPQVVDDYNGSARVTTANDIGAFKIASPALDVSASSIDIATPFCTGNEDVFLTISNNGTTRVDSLTINWSIDGITQTAINYTTLIDTIGSVAGNTAQVLLTNYSFAANTPVVFEAIVSGANGTTVPDAFPDNDTTTLTAGASISGTFTIDPNIAPSATNFISFTDLTTALNSFGICGPVNVTVTPGVYLETISLNNVIGGSSTNTITIDGVDSSATVLSHDGTSSFGTVSINGADYVTIRNMSIDYTGATGAGVITSNANHISIENSVISVDTNSTSFNLYGVSLSSSVSANSTGVVSDYFNLSNSIVKGGYYGFRAYGSTTNSVNGITLVGNDFQQIYYYGIYLYYTDSVDIVGNVIDSESRNNVNADGAYIYYTTNFDISRNIMRALDYGMYVYDFTGAFTQTRKNRIANNMIYSDSDYGLYMYYIDSTEIFHNTIVTNSTSIPAVQIYTSTTRSIGNYDIRNNIFYANGSFALRTNMPDTVFQVMDYNSYYTSGSDLFSINSSTYSNLAAYTTANAALNANSVEGDPSFINYPLDLHVLGALVNDIGDNSVGITVDVDGDTRPMPGSTTVDMGADEFDPPSCTPPTATTFTNVTINTADVAFTTPSTTSSFRYEYGTIGFTPGTSGGTSVLTTTATNTITGLASGTTYELYVTEICTPTDSSPTVGPYQFATAFSIPLNEDFETFTAGEFGPTFTNGWTGSAGTPRWEAEDATGANENSLNTGPFFDATTPSTVGGHYMYLETSSGLTGASGSFSSPSIFVPPSAGGIVMEFAYHMHGATMGDLIVMVDTNNVLDTIMTISGQQQAAQADPFRDTTALLVGYQNTSMKLVFQGVRGSSFTGDISIDNIRLFDTVAVDVALDTIVAPMSDCGLSNAEDVTIAIENRGLSPATGISATYIFDGGAPVTETVPVTINPGTTYNFTFATKVNASVVKSYTLDASISLASDGDTTNNSSTGYTFIGSFSDSISASSPLKYYTFESNDGNWVPSGANSSWEWGTPSSFYINGAIGTKAWVTSAAGNHNANEMSYLESSCYDLSTISPTTPILLNFQTLFKTEIGFDQVWMEYSIDNGRNWAKVLPSVAAINFYNNTTDNVWEGFSTGGVGTWIPVLNDLQGLGGNSKVKFRFAFVSNGTIENDGFAIDEFQVGTIVGVDEQSMNGTATLGLTPNPTRDVLNMTFGNYASGDYQMGIINARGQVVQEEVLTVGSSLETKTINVSSLEAGVYFVRTMNGEQISTQKLIIK